MEVVFSVEIKRYGPEDKGLEIKFPNGSSFLQEKEKKYEGASHLEIFNEAINLLGGRGYKYADTITPFPSFCTGSGSLKHSITSFWVVTEDTSA